jgi:hypothetical protein
MLAECCTSFGDGAKTGFCDPHSAMSCDITLLLDSLKRSLCFKIVEGTDKSNI